MNERSFMLLNPRKDRDMSKTIFTSPEQMIDLQSRMAAAMIEAADESTTRFETAARETVTVLANAMHANVERSIEAMNTASKLRAKTASIARDAMGIAPAAAK
jgi:hypothetical protein